MRFRIPYLHALGAGVHVSPETVAWVSLRRAGASVRVVFRAAEPVEDDDVDAALRRLLDRVPTAARPGGRAPLVAGRLDAFHGRTALLDAPALDEPDLRDAWLTSEALRLLPPGCRIEDFALRVQPVGAEPAGDRCLVHLARRTSVAVRECRFAEGGYRLLRLTLPEADLGPLLARLPAFTEGCTAVLALRPDEATLLVYRDGRLVAADRLLADDPDAPPGALLEAVRDHLADPDPARPAPDRLYLVGDETAVRRAPAAGLIAGPVLPATLTLPGCDDVPLSGAAFEAAALALGVLQTSIDDANLLETEVVRARRQALEKSEALRAILCVGGVLAVVFGLLMLAQTGVDLARSRTDQALALLADRLAAIESARTEVARLEVNVRETDRLIAAQTHTARVLETIGRAAPPELWLERVLIEPTGAETLRIRLTGAALHEGAVAAYLDRLERDAPDDAVRLIFAESVPVAPPYPDADALPAESVTRFEIALHRSAVPFAQRSPR